LVHLWQYSDETVESSSSPCAKRRRISVSLTNRRATALDGSVPDLRGQLAGLFSGTINLVQFQRWVGLNSLPIELHGSDEDVALLNVVEGRLAENTSDYIDAAELLDALQTDPLVRQELQTHRTAVA
jgi:hypothetical protein